MKKLSFLIVLCVTGISCRIVHAQNEVSNISSGGKLKPVQANMDIRHYTLSLNVDPKTESIDGFTEIDLVLANASDSLLFDLIKKYAVSEVTVDKAKATFAHNDDFIHITGKKFAAGKHKIRISYSGKPPVAVKPPWEGGFTWSKDKAGNPWIIINCQLQGSKIWYPCKDHPSDEPNEGADLFISVPKGLVVAGPGLLAGTTSKGDKSTFHWKTNYSISNYCILFNIGKYKVVTKKYTTVNGTVVPIDFYVLEQDVDKADHLIDMRARDTKILEKYFGEYPWAKEKIGIAQINNPGMEHQSMITYGDPFNYKKIGKEDYSDNLWLEYAHEWWANKVTNKDWAHMWIQEGICTFSESLFFREIQGEKGYDSVMYMVRAGIRNEKPVVQGDGLSMREIYNGDIYSKGAFFMNSLRYVLGDEVFFPTLKKFVANTNPASDFYTTSDIQAFFCKESGRDLNPLFDFYLRTTKTMDFDVYRVQPNAYVIRMNNIPMELPLEVLTDKGVEKFTIKQGDKPLRITSKTYPVIDPKERLFKKVTTQ